MDKGQAIAIVTGATDVRWLFEDEYHVCDCRSLRGTLVTGDRFSLDYFCNGLDNGDYTTFNNADVSSDDYDPDDYTPGKTIFGEISRAAQNIK